MHGDIEMGHQGLEDWIGEDNPVRVIDVFVEELDLGELGFYQGLLPRPTGSGLRIIRLCC